MTAELEKAIREISRQAASPWMTPPAPASQLRGRGLLVCKPVRVKGPSYAVSAAWANQLCV